MAAAAIHSGTQRTAQRIGELVHASHEAAMHAAKILRSAGLWPNPGSGVRNTPFMPGQLVNLLVALGGGDPIRGPEVVAAFRSLPPGPVWWTYTERVPLNRLMDDHGGYEGTTTTSRFTGKDGPYLRGLTFGDDLDSMVEEALADTDTATEAREHLRSARIILTLAPCRAAEIQIPIRDGWTQHITYGVEQIAPRSAAYRILEGSNGETVGVMESLAIIWRENQEALRPPTNETAAIHPLQGVNAAAPSQPPAERERGPQTPRKIVQRERFLNGRSVGSAGHSPFMKERLPYVRRPSAADPAGG